MKINKILLPLLLAWAVCGCAKQAEFVTGEVDGTEGDVGVKIAGRVSRIAVKEGDTVVKDQVLGNLQSREMEARLQTAEAAARDASEQYDLAEKTYDRVKNLFETGVVPKQQYDEAKYKYEAARQKIKAVGGQLDEVKAYYDEMLLKSPINGEVVQIISHPGEIVSPGYPIITVLDLNDQWVVFNLREDRLKNIRKGATLNIELPALGKSCPFTVTYISALGAFAKWKATNETGSFDLKTFEVRARSEARIDGMRPGMTALVKFPVK
jgi:HlyD family secretion protein